MAAHCSDAVLLLVLGGLFWVLVLAGSGGNLGIGIIFSPAASLPYNIYKDWKGDALLKSFFDRPFREQQELKRQVGTELEGG